MIVPFNKPCFLGSEIAEMNKAIINDKISGDGPYTKLCEEILTNLTKRESIITTSCTHALEMIALIESWGISDEIIVPSFTFVSSALAFSKFGIKISFCDVNPETGSTNLNFIKKKVNKKTVAVVLVHYAGMTTNDINDIVDFCQKNNLILIEDAAQAINSFHDNKHLGSFGDYGTISFHETKNITSGGEGGALLIKNPDNVKKAYIIRDKGTNRKEFFNGQVDKYSWKSIGSSYVLSDMSVAYLYVQLLNLKLITEKRTSVCKFYSKELQELKNKGKISFIDLSHGNGHLFFILTENRNSILSFLRKKNIEATFHYLPLEKSNFVNDNKHLFDFSKKDLYNSSLISERILRLPVFYSMSSDQYNYVIKTIKSFYE